MNILDFKKKNNFFEWILWIWKKWIFALNEYSGILKKQKEYLFWMNILDFYMKNFWTNIFVNKLADSYWLCKLCRPQQCFWCPLSISNFIYLMDFGWMEQPARYIMHHMGHKHHKNCECCPGHYLIVNHYSSMSWFKFHNMSVMVNYVTKSQTR